MSYMVMLVFLLYSSVYTPSVSALSTTRLRSAYRGEQSQLLWSSFGHNRHLDEEEDDHDHEHEEDEDHDVLSEHSDLGYDTTVGTSALCWRSTVTDTDDHETIPILPHAGIASTDSEVRVCNSEAASLKLHPLSTTMDVPGGALLRTFVDYSVDVEVTLDLDTLLHEFETGVVGHSHELDEEIYDPVFGCSLKLIFCKEGQVGFCSPFVHDEDAEVDQDHTHDGSGSSTHQESELIWIDFTPTESMSFNQSLHVEINQEGSFFVIATLQFFTYCNETDTNNTLSRWDIANAYSPSVGRTVTFVDPVEIVDVSKAVLWISYVAIAVASLIILFLIWQLIRHRDNQIVSLSQGGFLMALLCAALVASIGCVLFRSTSEAQCQLEFPFNLLPLHLMYAIVLGRLWRINAVVSPLLMEKYSKNQKSGFGIAKCIDKIRRFLGLKGQSKGLRQAVTSKSLAFGICVLMFPQVVLHVCLLVFQPQQLVLIMNDELTRGRYQCVPSAEPYASFMVYSAFLLLSLIFLLLMSAYSSRKLPSLFNESRVIYSTTLNTLVLVLIAVVGTIATDSNAVNPDVDYLMKVMVNLSLSLGTSLRMMLPKLQMIWRGEVVVVSKLVADHREKESLRHSSGHSTLLNNVSGFGNNSSRRPRQRPSSFLGSTGEFSSIDYDVPEFGSSAASEKRSSILGKTSSAQHDDLEDDDSIHSTEGKRNPIPGIIRQRDIEAGCSPRGVEEDMGKDADSEQDTTGGQTEETQRTSHTSLGQSEEFVPSSERLAEARKRRERVLEQRRKQQEQEKIYVCNTVSPPRRLVLKMVELQGLLESFNEKVMAGVLVQRLEWDTLLDRISSLDRVFRERFVFLWRMDPEERMRLMGDETTGNGAVQSKVPEKVRKQCMLQRLMNGGGGKDGAAKQVVETKNDQQEEKTPSSAMRTDMTGHVDCMEAEP